jgi:hypothetical protein
MTAPVDSLIQRLHRRGFCTTTGESVTKLGWTNLDPEQIISLYSGINRGIQNYYRFVDNVDGLIRVQYILRFSLARTLAAKYKLSVKKVFVRFGNNITVTVKGRDGKRNRSVSFYLNNDWEKKRMAFSTSNTAVDLVQMAIRMRTRSKLGRPCCICGSLEQVEMHHVRHIRKIESKKATGFKSVMRALNRKQIPTCRPCHHKIHQGQYDGISLRDFSYDPR